MNILKAKYHSSYRDITLCPVFHDILDYIKIDLAMFRKDRPSDVQKSENILPALTGVIENNCNRIILR
ncbi:hypothetical protein QE152_g8953 [Popillia japonica]|uniref:Uncharacterized protein n=1 Tax=Popillia japonica TaxID=7064 RepID=A0AAW1M168_POPJA